MRIRVVFALLSILAIDAHAATRGFVLFAAPPTNNSESSSAAIDLDGDGGAENQLGSVFATLAGSADFDFGAPVASGEVVYLLRVTSADPAFTADAAAQADWIVGLPTAPTPPDFSGAGSFALDPTEPALSFVAPLAGGVFTSPNPVTANPQRQATLQLDLSGRVVLPLVAARLRFTVTPGGIVAGQVNGSLTVEDVQNILVPALADEFTDRIAANDSSKATIKGLFDDGCSGVGVDDDIITPCEINESLFATLLEPDLDLYDTNGQYAPNPNGTGRDALSFGMLFTGSNATLPLEVVFQDSFE